MPSGTFKEKPDVSILEHFQFEDEINRISLSASSLYSKLTINGREYLFIRETGEFDGWSERLVPYGPTLIYDEKE